MQEVPLKENFGNPVILVDPARSEIDSTELKQFAQRAKQLVDFSGKVDILITGNQRMKELNRRFRKKNEPTDVLSFLRQNDLTEEAETGGDIAISAEIASDNAARYGHSMSDELKILILHGVLHLAGFDHERDNGEMAARETELRMRLRLPLTLIERSRKRPELP